MTQAGLDLSAYQAELELQNQALRYAQLAAEGASERFLALFSSVPLALMVIDVLAVSAIVWMAYCAGQGFGWLLVRYWL